MCAIAQPTLSPRPTKMSEELVVGVAQMVSTDDVDRNLAQILELLNSLTEPVDLVVFPENCLFFRTDSRIPMRSFAVDDPVFKKICAACAKFKTKVFLGGVQIKGDQGICNSIVEVGPKQNAKVLYSKIHMFDVDVAGAPPVRESDVYRAGIEPVVVRVGPFLIGLTICYDLRFSNLFERYALRQVDAILVPSSFLVPTGKAHWHVLLRARAIESQCFVIAPAQAGTHLGATGQRETFGHSLVVGPWGEIMVDFQAQEPKLEIVRLNKLEIEKVRKQIPMRSHRKELAVVKSEVAE